MTYYSTVYNDIVFVKIGPSETKFGIHRGLLTKSSSFFDQILEPDFKSYSEDPKISIEAGSTVITLPSEDVTTFSRVNSWFFTQRFRYPDEEWSKITWRHLIDVYLFAVHKNIPTLQNICINSTILKVKDGCLFPGQDTINSLWRTGPGTIRLRRLFIKLFASHCELKKAILNNNSFNQTFLNWIVIELYEMQKKGIKPEDVNLFSTRKDYHVFGAENPIPLD